MRSTWFRSMMSSLAWFTPCKLFLLSNIWASRCFWNSEENSSSGGIHWTKTQTFLSSSKWISYQVEIFFANCKSFTTLDTCRHRRHSKITGNRWITFFFSNFFFLVCICQWFENFGGKWAFNWLWPEWITTLITTGVASRVDLLTLTWGRLIVCCEVEKDKNLFYFVVSMRLKMNFILTFSRWREGNGGNHGISSHAPFSFFSTNKNQQKLSIH